ncbi:ADP-glyceromanno-heptose 6-epimerase [Candidatus Dojkabacteria bacterium]|jgi:ADP-L-glycero-D-manno-heptose 6-epimerase|nr:ADP-glyceromanno-heptose 6-epimerase [Candidatus Dojkabacteria bacterium]
MIIVTGGEGFIGKNLMVELLNRGYSDVKSLDVKTIPLDEIERWLIENGKKIEFVIHLGAITDTTEDDLMKLNKYNFSFSIFIWGFCSLYKIPLIYASSAATYGDGKQGFDDEIDINNLRPLNAYGDSKHNFDKYVLDTTLRPPKWYGLKFFNVYGNGEEHKGHMASVVFHAYNQIKVTGEIKLFKSYHKDCRDGEQRRDFIYVDDVVNTIIYLMEHPPKSGIYNVGTGNARSFNDLAKAIFKSLGINEKISYIDMPTNLMQTYQYFTEAKISKLKGVGCDLNFYELENGVDEYIKKLQYENC